LQGDFQSAARSDDVAHTINYYDVAQRVTRFCEEHSFKLIERLASELASLILKEFRPAKVTVEVKKFILSNARYVSFKHTRTAPGE
jgi:dihydroneopterin aldolase